MEQENKICNKKCCGRNRSTMSGDAVYFFGLVGSAVYYVQHSDTFMMGLIGILKAIIWPAMMIYKTLELLKF